MGVGEGRGVNHRQLARPMMEMARLYYLTTSTGKTKTTTVFSYCNGSNSQYTIISNLLMADCLETRDDGLPILSDLMLRSSETAPGPPLALSLQSMSLAPPHSHHDVLY